MPVIGGTFCGIPIGRNQSQLGGLLGQLRIVGQQRRTNISFGATLNVTGLQLELPVKHLQRDVLINRDRIHLDVASRRRGTRLDPQRRTRAGSVANCNQQYQPARKIAWPLEWR